MAFTTVEVQEHLDTLKAVLQDVGPAVAKLLTELILQSKRRPTRAEALHFLGTKLLATAEDQKQQLVKKDAEKEVLTEAVAVLSPTEPAAAAAVPADEPVPAAEPEPTAAELTAVEEPVPEPAARPLSSRSQQPGDGEAPVPETAVADAAGQEVAADPVAAEGEEVAAAAEQDESAPAKAAEVAEPEAAVEQEVVTDVDLTAAVEQEVVTDVDLTAAVEQVVTDVDQDAAAEAAAAAEEVAEPASDKDAAPDAAAPLPELPQETPVEEPAAPVDSADANIDPEVAAGDKEEAVAVAEHVPQEPAAEPAAEAAPEADAEGESGKAE